MRKSAVTKCVACAGGQYGVVGGTTLTTGLTAMRPLRRHVDHYIAVSTAVAVACSSLTAGGQRTIDVIPPFCER